MNPARTDSLALIRLLNEHKDEVTEEAVHELLAKGENPNQQDATGWTPIYNAICTYGINILKILLVYGADPFRRDNGIWFESAIECARAQNRVDALCLFRDTFSKPKKSLTAHNALRVKDVTLSEKDKIITTRFDFTNNMIIKTYLKPVELLSKAEKDTLRPIFFNTFDDPKGDKSKVEKIFNDDFAPDKKNQKLIETIVEVNPTTGIETVVGLNFFSVIFNVEEKPIKHVVVCEYAGMDKSFQHMGLGFILMCRPAFGLQPLLKDLITLHLSAINYNSYHSLEKLLHYPKYQPEHARRINLMKKTIEREYGKDAVYFLNGLTAFIFDALIVKDSKTPQNVWSEFFDKKILGNSTCPETPDGASRGGLVLVDIADELLRKVTEICHNFGFNFIIHMDQLASLLPKIIDELKDKKPDIYKLLKNYPTTSGNFWEAPKDEAPKNIDLTRETPTALRISKV